MWLYDPVTFRLLAANDAALSACGYSRDEVAAMRICDFLPEERLRDHLGPDGGLRHAFWKLRVKDGALRDVRTCAATIELAGRQARLVLAQDVTEEVRLEQQLHQARKLATLGRLTSGIAHDFNNVLLVIQGHGGLLRNRLHDPELLGRVADIEAAAQRARDLTRKLLAFGRSEALRPEPTDLNAAVQEALELIKPTLGATIAIETRLEPAVRRARLDRSQLTQALFNLALNARDALSDGGTLSLRTTNVELDESHAAPQEGVAPGPYALLQVSDSGEGMDEETRRRAFDPFFTTKGDGTGLGLANVHVFVRQSGGHVAVASHAGRGTTFSLYFPAVP
jgi:PAS domain S-box-containing protein